ncbi:hypothetical protein IEQ34_002912 [Dendrobium chrysotoxum]|uniref:Uncharacterized protein n=1 Tax=Dendrobium chrysotoxum TaxID=161865 RepID=A0AAV7H292_DENCH|nr:hypothetical protein IEQ34_002912 [Dendrobium chrysotoxum]
MVLLTSVARQRSFRPPLPADYDPSDLRRQTTVLLTSVACRLWPCRPNEYVNTYSSNSHHEEYTRLRESQSAAGEGSSAGSTDYSDYRTWSQAVGGMQHGRVYGLGSQAYAYEGQSSSGGSFSSSTQESLYTQQIAALRAELEQVRKAQADWQMQIQQQQMQIQQQQAQMLEEMRKMRKQISSDRSTASP